MELDLHIIHCILVSEAINEILVVGEVVTSEVLSLGEDVSFGKIITPLESFIEGVRSIDDIATFVSFVVSAERAKYKYNKKFNDASFHLI